MRRLVDIANHHYSKFGVNIGCRGLGGIELVTLCPDAIALFVDVLFVGSKVYAHQEFKGGIARSACMAQRRHEKVL